MIENSVVPPVIYIMGRPHSGSTILSSLLANTTSVDSVGELHTIMYGDDRDCACGEKIRSCSLWSKIISLFEKESSTSWGDFTKLVFHFHKVRSAANFIFNSNSSAFKSYKKGYNHLYPSILECTSCKTIVDSTRNPFHALFVLRQNKYNKIIFLIRNGNDALYSKFKRISEDGEFQLFGKTWKGVRIFLPFLVLFGLSWCVGNLVSEIIYLLNRKRIYKLRYEDLCSDHAKTLTLLGEFCNIDFSNVIRLVNEQKPMTIGHEIGGNRLRFKGSFVFRPDSNKPLRLKYRLIFAAFAWPLLFYYGYFRKK